MAEVEEGTREIEGVSDRRSKHGRRVRDRVNASFVSVCIFAGKIVAGFLVVVALVWPEWGSAIERLVDRLRSCD